MKKLIVLFAALTFATSAMAGLVSKPFTFTNNTVADANQVNSDFDTLYSLVNGNLDSANLAAGAIGTSEIADNSVNFLKIDWGTGSNQVRGTETTTWRLGQGGANFLDIANPVLTGNRTWTLQDSSDTFVGRATTDTLSAKTFTLPQLNDTSADHQYVFAVSELAADRTVTFPLLGAGDTFVFEAFAQSLSNKTLPSPTITGTVVGGATYSSVTLTSPVVSGGSGSLVPVGTIVAHYDFNATVAIDSAYWVYCDGSVISNGSSPINGLTTPDLSGRYMVGFGTDGGGDIDTATWATAAVGNAGHTVNLQHSHTVDSHTHDLANHTHTGPSHSHTVGTLQFTVMRNDVIGGGDADIYFYNSAGTEVKVIGQTSQTYNTGASLMYDYSQIAGADQTYYTASGTGSTATGGTGATGTPSSNTSGTASPGTNTQLSTTQSIQPRSLRVRYVMRVR